MDDVQRWRVVLDGGEVREVRLTPPPTPHTARAMLMRYALQQEWPVREILAPGERSAEERERAAAVAFVACPTCGGNPNEARGV